MRRERHPFFTLVIVVAMVTIVSFTIFGKGLFTYLSHLVIGFFIGWNFDPVHNEDFVEEEPIND